MTVAESARTAHYVAIEPPRIFPALRFNDAATMIDWLVDVLGFTVHAKYMDGDKVAHAELAFGSSMIMLGDAKPDAFGALVGAPGDTGGKSLYVVVDDADALYERVKAAGARILQAPTDRDYGSREFICADPEGNVWSFGTYWPKAHEEAH
ncbi:VOC family protein [Mesorhizobium xinjiangense]|uniref:VOC family protein n=1 Tax=Mesorhizobium xinjiangense TaxID=2678685 RepID=UPI0012EDCD40|nr:VOC family protein [Mesorhizobium xinjiangense]